MSTLTQSAAMRRQRVVEARRMATYVERETQWQFRAALIQSVEYDLAARKLKWEQEKQAQIDALRKIYVQSLAMLGAGQKDAAQALAEDAAGAQEHVQAWEALAASTLARGEEALAVELYSQAQYKPLPVDVDTAIYRHEVQKAAAMHERWQARRASTSKAASAAASGGNGQAKARGVEAGVGAEVHPDGDRYGRPRKLSTPRNHPLYGPHSAGNTGRRVVPGSKGRGVALSPRVPQDGPADHTSVVRVEVRVQAGEHADGPSQQTGVDKAEADSAALLQARCEAGAAEERKDAAHRDRMQAAAVARNLAEEGFSWLTRLEEMDLRLRKGKGRVDAGASDPVVPPEAARREHFELEQLDVTGDASTGEEPGAGGGDGGGDGWPPVPAALQASRRNVSTSTSTRHAQYEQGYVHADAVLEGMGAGEGGWPSLLARPALARDSGSMSDVEGTQPGLGTGTTFPPYAASLTLGPGDEGGLTAALGQVGRRVEGGQMTAPDALGVGIEDGEGYYSHFYGQSLSGGGSASPLSSPQSSLMHSPRSAAAAAFLETAEIARTATVLGTLSTEHMQVLPE